MGRIVAFGDSITLGEMGASYMKHVEKEYEVLNLGVNGLSTHSEVDVIKDYFEKNDTANDDAYILAIGSNDIIGPTLKKNGDLIIKVVYLFDKQEFNPVVENYKKELDACLQEISKAEKPIILICPPHVQIKSVSEEQEIAFNSAVKELGEQYKATVIDMLALQKENYTNEEYYQNVSPKMVFFTTMIKPLGKHLALTQEGIHSSEKTAEIEGKAVLEALNKLR